MAGINVDFAALTSAYGSNPPFQATVDYLASRQREPKKGETKTGNLALDLNLRGHKFHVLAIEAALKVFADAKCGNFIRGNPSKNHRLKWDVPALDIAREILDLVKEDGKDKGHAADGMADPAAVIAETSEISVSAHPEIDTYLFPVRRGVSLKFPIRADMTSAEIQNLADFVRIIAASRASDKTSS